MDIDNTATFIIARWMVAIPTTPLTWSGDIIEKLITLIIAIQSVLAAAAAVWYLCLIEPHYTLWGHDWLWDVFSVLLVDDGGRNWAHTTTEHESTDISKTYTTVCWATTYLWDNNWYNWTRTGNIGSIVPIVHILASIRRTRIKAGVSIAYSSD